MTARTHRLIVVALVLSLLAPALVACGSRSPDGSGVDAARSEELTPGEFPERVPPDPVEPPPPMLRDPKKAVFSYLLWISYAYRVLDSDVATHAFSEWEEVRVNSYVELNRQNSRAIDQRLVEFESELVESKGDTATVSAREVWTYRYISTADGTYDSPAHSVTYETTYTVVNVDGKGWLVDKVEVNPLGGQPE